MTKKIYIEKSRIIGAGSGVFTKQKIKAGEQIEICPLLIIPKLEIDYLNNSFFVNYLFYFGKNKDKAGLAMGLGSFYNHCLKPNASFEIDEKKEIIEFTAIKDIKKDEEITFNYYASNDPKDLKTPLWFES